MGFYETLINKAFFLVDRLRGKRILNELKTLEDFYEKEQKNEHGRLNIFLNDLNRNVPFYVDNPIHDFNKTPISTKGDINKNFNELISVKYDKENLIKVTTSGSYGTPMAFYRNKNKQLRQTAEVLYFGEKLDYFIGRNHAFIRGVSKSKLKLLLQNEVHIDPTHLDSKSLQEIIEKIKKTKFIIGFPSVIMSIIKYCKEAGVLSSEFNLIGIIATSEPLSESQRKAMAEFFACPVVARYATEELGIIANQCLDTEEYHINEASFIVEVLDKDSNNTLELGEEGRIIVTDLYSNAMPLVRYDTGDFGILEQGCTCGYKGKILKKITGRKIQNLIDVNGNEVSPFSINVKMKDYINIYQFQFIQENYNEYNMLLVVNESFDENENLLNDLRKILGKSANIKIEKVDDIAPLPSGKRPYIINKLYD